MEHFTPPTPVHPGPTRNRRGRDPAETGRGARLENRALMVTATGGLLALAAVALIRCRPGIDPARVLKPPPESERFVVYINDDDWPTIALLPRIGETLARRIVAARLERGRFQRLEDLLRVRGIGRGTLGYLRPYVRLDRRPATRRVGP